MQNSMAGFPEWGHLVCVCVGKKAENCINYKIKISGAKQWGDKPIFQAVGRSTHSPQNKGKTLNVDVHFFCFRLDIPSLGKFGPKTQNCQFKLEFGTQTNLNMQNLVEMFTFSVFKQKHFFGEKFGPKNQNLQLRLKFGTRANSKMQN